MNSIGFNFPNELIAHCTHFLKISDVAHMELVCTAWKRAIEENDGIWVHMFQNEKIPLVYGKRNYKQDFRILYPMCVSGRTIERCYGRMLGQLPFISPRCFNKVFEQDEFEPEKTKAQTYVFVVVPHKMRKNLRIKTKDNKTLDRLFDITFTVKNTDMVSCQPRIGKKHLPVFSKEINYDELERCKDDCADKVTIYFMRKEVPKQTMNLHYNYQVGMVEKIGLQVTPLRERAFYNAVSILTAGTCPDNKSIYARTSNAAHTTGGGYGFYKQICIGNYIPGEGLWMGEWFDYDDDGTGVVPGMNAEVTEKDLVDLKINQ